MEHSHLLQQWGAGLSYAYPSGHRLSFQRKLQPPTWEALRQREWEGQDGGAHPTASGCVAVLQFVAIPNSSAVGILEQVSKSRLHFPLAMQSRGTVG